jgi:release factor glutamine methyltransferase
MLLHQALQQATQQLAQQGIPSPANDAKRLLLWCMEIDSMEYTQLSKSCSLNKKTLLKFGSVIEQRLLRRPVSQIVGSRAFYGRAFFVNTDVL